MVAKRPFDPDLGLRELGMDYFSIVLQAWQSNAPSADFFIWTFFRNTVECQFGSIIRSGVLSWTSVATNIEFCKSADNLCKQFRPRSGPIEHHPDLDPNHLTLWLCSWKIFFLKKINRQNKSMKNYPVHNEFSIDYRSRSFHMFGPIDDNCQLTH